MLQLYNKNHQKICILKDCKDVKIERELKTSDCKLSFSYPIFSTFYEDIVEESYIRTKENEYVVKEIHELDQWTEFICTMNVENLEGKAWDRFESKEQTITNALNLCLVDTHWRVGHCDVTKKRTVRQSNCSSWDIIQDIKKTYRVDMQFDCINKIINIYEHLGNDKGVYFMDSINVKKLEIQSSSYTFYTRIKPIGKDNLSIKDINNGKDYVENYQYSSKIKTFIWKDDRYTVVENLKADAQAKLNDLSKPRRAYQVDIINLAKENKKYSVLDYSLGDTITLISKDKNIKEKQRIVKTTENLLDHSLDSVEIANTVLSFEDIQQNLQDSADTVDNITTDNGTVDGSCIDSIETKQISDFKANVIRVGNLKALNADIKNLKADKADIQDLHAVKAEIGTLKATEGEITHLKSDFADIQKLVANKANINDLESNTAKIKVLESDNIATQNLFAKYSTIENLNSFKANFIEMLSQKATIGQAKILEGDITKLKSSKADISELNVLQGNFKSINSDVAKFKSVFSDVLASGKITANSSIIAEGAIGDAQISSLSANKISSGTIDTSKIQIIGGKGRFRIVGDKLQVLDNKDGKLYERIMLGVDDKNNSALVLRGADGKTVLLDQNGLSKEGFTDGYNKVSDGTLDASKFDFKTVVKNINNGTETIEGTKVHIGDKTLNVELSTQKNKIDEHSKDLLTQSTQIKALDKEIKLKVDEQQLNKSKKELVDNLNNNLEQINTKFNKTTSELQILKTKINSSINKTDLENTKLQLNGQIVETENKINSIQSDITQTTNSIKEQINSLNSDTIKNIDGIKQDTQQRLMSFERTLDSINMSISKFNKSIDTKADKSEIQSIQKQLSELKVDNTGIHEHVEETNHHITTIVDGIEQIKDDLVYKVEIFSTNGAVFQNGIIDTTLQAILYRGKNIITDKFGANQFRWTRISKDIEGDKIWNQKHFGGTKSIHITASDVYARATFNVEVFDKDGATRLCATY